MGMRKVTTIAVIFIASTVAVRPTSAKDKNEKDVVRSYSVPVDKVYAAVVQVVSARYNLKSAIKEG
jgi:hypothetical protein